MNYKIEKYNDALKGVIYLDNKEIEVKNTIVGEVVSLNVSKDFKNVTFNNIQVASSDRVCPNCKIYPKCGGCSLLHIDYKKQLEIKKEKLNELFLKKLNLKSFVKDVLGMNNPYNYRNKNQMEFRLSKQKEIIGGYYEEGSHNVLDASDCLIQDKIINDIFNYIKVLIKKYHYEPYDEDKKRGLIRHVLIKRSNALDEVMVCIVTGDKFFPGGLNFSKDLVKKFPSIKTVIQNINTRSTSVVLGDEEKVIYGPGFIYDILMGKKFKVSAKSFYQVNSLQCEVLYSKAIELAKLSKNDILLDAYSGVGTIGLICADKVRSVISVELNKDAVKDAITNAKINKITNINFYNDDATKFITKFSETRNAKVSCVIMDPPRAGSTKEFIDAVLKLEPEKVVYISCNPYTQVDDLRYFLKKYNIKVIQPVDMFPHTYHVENIVLLEKKTQK